jgi:hypothetical protein
VDFEPSDYYRAARERIKQAQDLYRQDSKDERSTNHHPLAFYTCGVAVECMLRAFITRRTREFDGRHDLEILLGQSGLLSLDKAARLDDADLDRLKIELGGAVNKVNRLWNNSLRYASENRLRAYLHELKFDQKIKGDSLKEGLRQLLEASSRVIDRGVMVWET